MRKKLQASWEPLGETGQDTRNTHVEKQSHIATAPHARRAHTDAPLLAAGLIQKLNGREDVRLVRLDDAPVHDHLVEDEVRLLEVEHDVELAHVLKIAVERLDERMDELEDRKLVLIVALDANNEEERRVPSVNDLVAAKFIKGTLGRVQGDERAWTRGWLVGGGHDPGFFACGLNSARWLGAHLRVRARQAFADDFRLKRAALVHLVRLVVLREPRLALLVDHEDEADGHGCVWARLTAAGSHRRAELEEHADSPRGEA